MGASRGGVQIRSGASGPSDPPVPCWLMGPTSDLGTRRDGLDHAADRLVDRHAVVLSAVAVAERHRAGLDVAVTRDHHERNLLELGIADLLLHPIVGDVDLDAYAGSLQLLGHVEKVVVVSLRDRDPLHLDRCEPGWEGTGIVLDENAHEPLDGAELGRVDHHRLLSGAVSRSEEHTSELQSLMRISYAVFCLTK